MSDISNEDDLLRTKLNGETARFAWKQLQRFYASGAVIVVAEDLDLVEVAFQIAKDNKAAVEQWMAGNRLGRATDEQAQAWLDADIELWTVVVKPWILVQQPKAH